MSRNDLHIDLNSDLGEGFGPWKMGPDAELMPLISSANIACGFHAGDPLVIEQSIGLAQQHGVGIGAHPGFPDRVGFGRRTINATFDEIRTDVMYQIGAVDAFCRSQGAKLQHVKAHGALYNLAVKDSLVAEAIASAVKQINPTLIFFALPGSELEAAGEAAGLTLAREAFADRAYRADGSLVPRSQPNSVITDHDLVAKRMIRLVTEGVIKSIEGTDLRIAADTICLHSDTPSSLEIAQTIRTAFQEHGITVRPVGSTVE